MDRSRLAPARRRSARRTQGSGGSPTGRGPKSAGDRAMPVTVTVVVGPSGGPGSSPEKAASTHGLVIDSSRQLVTGSRPRSAARVGAHRHLVGTRRPRRPTLGHDRRSRPWTAGRRSVARSPTTVKSGRGRTPPDARTAATSRGHRSRRAPAGPPSSVVAGSPPVMGTATSEACVASRNRSNAVRDRAAAANVASTTAAVTAASSAITRCERRRARHSARANAPMPPPRRPCPATTPPLNPRIGPRPIQGWWLSSREARGGSTRVRLGRG